MSIYISKVKSQVTIQDGGRWGFQSSGVPISGPMDALSFCHANLLVGNISDAACFEVGIGSLELVFKKVSLFSVCGNGHEIFINEEKISQGKPILAKGGCTLKLKPSLSGLWSYVAIGGGISCPQVLGSRSTYLQSGFGGIEGRALQAADVIETNEIRSPITDAIVKSLSKIENDFVTSSWSIGQNYESGSLIRIMPGPEWNWLNASYQKKITDDTFTISNESNRMGYRLKGKPILRQTDEEMISSGVTKGTVQLTNDGSLIVLMADSQTVGGYPRVAQVASIDIPKFSQQRPGAEVRFELISHEESEQLFLEADLDLKKVAAGIRLRVL